VCGALQPRGDVDMSRGQGWRTEFRERRPITLLYAGWIPQDRFSSWPSGNYQREFDSETGLYYYRARYYDPTAGRDPAKFQVLVEEINPLLTAHEKQRKSS
jgi:hypothetical protein